VSGEREAEAIALLRQACENWPHPNRYDWAVDALEAALSEARRERELAKSFLTHEQLDDYFTALAGSSTTETEPAVASEEVVACRAGGVGGNWCCAPWGHDGDHIWNDLNGIPGTVGYATETEPT
jgi:hypothetical protein